MTARPFALFGVDHIAALAAIGGAAAALTVAVRRTPRGALARVARYALAALLVSGMGVAAVTGVVELGLSPWELLPLHLCDFAVLLAAFALLTLRRGAYEWLYFWAGAATLLALLTPDLDLGFPDQHFVTFFALHGGVVASALVLTLGFGMRPREGAPRRVFLLTNAYAGVAAAANFVLGTNYLYLRAKPRTPTILDWLGPWPVYILVGEALAIALFLALDRPFRRARRGSSPARREPPPRGASRPR